MSKDIILEIKQPHINTAEKVQAVLDVLSKATGNKIIIEDEHDDSPSEPTPYLCLRELSDDIYKPIQKDLMELYSMIVSKWLRLDLEKARDRFKINGKVYINPKTGKYLTEREWKTIQDDLTRVFKWLYGRTRDATVKKALAMGKILQAMDPDARIDADIDDLKLNDAMAAVDADKEYKYILDFANVHTGELIQDVTERSRKAIVRVIMQGYQDRISNSELEDNLFEEFSTLNRDFRRIAETETATNFNNGYLIGELEEASNKDEVIFMQGISGAGACSFCSTEINNRIVVLLKEPPATGGDTVVVNGKTFTAIWPGKNNFGRKRAQWWVSAGTQHPHCRCNWIRVGDVTDEYISRLRAAMKS